MLLNPGISASVISDATRHRLITLEVVHPDTSANAYWLRDLKIGRDPVPDVEVVVEPMVAGANGMLGLNFLEHYRDLYHDAGAELLVFIDP